MSVRHVTAFASTTMAGLFFTLVGIKPMQAPEKRVVKLPVGVPVLLSEPNPNPTNANSAVAISFQVRV